MKSWLTVNVCRHTSILLVISHVFYNGIGLTEYSHKWWFCSNDDPIFGHASLDSSNELWSSKDVSNNVAPLPLDTPSSSGALRNRTESLEIKEEYVQCSDESLDLSNEKIGGPGSQVIENSCTTTANVGNGGVRSKPTGKEQQVCQFSQWSSIFVIYLSIGTVDIVLLLSFRLC